MAELRPKAAGEYPKYGYTDAHETYAPSIFCMILFGVNFARIWFIQENRMSIAYVFPSVPGI
jgi:hypothetical protein